MRLLFAIGVLAASPLATALPFLPKKPVGPPVLIVADAMADVPEEFMPTPERPVYYYLLGGKERHLGDIAARDPMPDLPAIAAAAENVLASQGFIRTGIGGPIPSIAIALTWGSANLTYMDFEETNDDTGETSTSTVMFNRREIMRLLGTYKANRRMFSYRESDEINAAANEDRFYLFIAALDIAALAKKEKKLLWRTRISIPSRRTTLPESMGLMLASAAPFLGRDVDKPVVIDDRVRRQRAEVIIGPTTVVEEDAGGGKD